MDKIKDRYVYDKLMKRKAMTSCLHGRGLEIGAGNLPMLFINQVKMTYLDKNPQENLKILFPQYDYPVLENFILGDADHCEQLASLPPFDFLVNAHVIEHVKNPLRSLHHWYNLIKPGGFLYIIIPNRDDTFDRGRNYTPLEHLREEYALDNDSAEMKANLIAHITEHLSNTNFKGREEELNKPGAINFDEEIRLGASHLHVFGVKNSYEMFEYARERLKLNITIAEQTYSPDELRFLIKKG